MCDQGKRCALKYYYYYYYIYIAKAHPNIILYVDIPVQIHPSHGMDILIRKDDFCNFLYHVGINQKCMKFLLLKEILLNVGKWKEDFYLYIILKVQNIKNLLLQAKINQNISNFIYFC